MAINFPILDPVILSLGPIAVRWYGLAYVGGILLGLSYIKKLNKKPPVILTKQALDSLVPWMVISIIIGGRLGYVLFYNFNYYSAEPIEILKTWKGGMAFHGGLIGVGLGLWFYCKKYKLRFWQVSDLVVCAAPIGIALGRLGNFINGELYGRVTSVSWGIIFPETGPYPRHPSQLYESLAEGVIPFIILFIMANKYKVRANEGLLSGVFIFLYSVARISMENFREPDSQYGLLMNYFSMGQLLSLPLLICSLIIIYQALKTTRM